MQHAWRDFKSGTWKNEINVRNFIQKNYTVYEGDESFLEGVLKQNKHNRHHNNIGTTQSIMTMIKNNGQKANEQELNR